MDRAEVFELLIVIKENYPNFDVSDDSVERHFKYLNDFPFAVALRNVDEHIRTNKYPPNIAEIRGRLGEQIERTRMKQETDEYFDQLDAWRQNAAPPPPGNLERVRALVKGEGA
ncbi:replicative helicase loader/inhibitor [Paenibacillus thiaminolyticus]|uniref:hypothetical protein n=1 Tax=Paenibacillus thiaminolyticus TaxID=49283 RepID=UPI003D2C308C